MGAITCMGVATANSVLVVSFARQRMNAGDDALQAALTAGYTRFRPVLMTALAMIVGMVPMALGLGEGAEQNAPLGRAVIGGLIFATVATLFFVPTVFVMIHGRKVGGARGPSAECPDDRPAATRRLQRFRTRGCASTPGSRPRSPSCWRSGASSAASAPATRSADESAIAAATTVVTVKPTRRTGVGSAGPARQCAGQLRGAHLRANQRLSSGLVHGHRHAGQEGSAARRDRIAGGRSAAEPGPGGPRDRRGELPARQVAPMCAGRACWRPSRYRSRTPSSERVTPRPRRRPSSRRPRTSRVCARWNPSSECWLRSMAWSRSATPTSERSSTPGRARGRRYSGSPTPIACESTCRCRSHTRRAFGRE